MMQSISDIKFSDYVTPKEYIEYSGINIEEEEITEKQIENTINVAGYLLCEYVDKPFLRQRFKNSLSGKGTDRLFLEQSPEVLINITEVRNGEEYNLSVENFYTNKEHESIVRTDGIFYNGYIYEVNYLSGPVELEDKVRHAVMITVTDILNKADYKEIGSIKVDVITVQFKDKGLPSEEVKQLLSGYCINSRII